MTHTTNDNNTHLAKLKKLVENFVNDREWQKFHTPKDISISIAVEAAELMELFQWMDCQTSIQEIERKRTDVENELADVLFCVLNFAQRYNIDLSTALKDKIAILNKNYPVATTKGDYRKYELAKANRKK